MESFCPSCGHWSGDLVCSVCQARKISGVEEGSESPELEHDGNCTRCSSRVVKVSEAESEYDGPPVNAKPEWGKWLVRPIPWGLVHGETLAFGLSIVGVGVIFLLFGPFGVAVGVALLITGLWFTGRTYKENQKVAEVNSAVRTTSLHLIMLADELREMHVCLNCGLLQTVDLETVEDYWSNRVEWRDCHNDGGKLTFLDIYYWWLTDLRSYFDPKFVSWGEKGSPNSLEVTQRKRNFDAGPQM
jgi:hypothetical protein